MYYTYLIGWSISNKWYYGVRYKDNCSPEDLWTTYFTSSDHVKKFRLEVGEPDIIKIRKIFDSKLSAVKWESKVLSSIPKDKRSLWLNKSFGNIKNMTMDDEVRLKIGKGNKGKLVSKETCLKISNAKRGVPSKLKGISRSEASTKKCSDSLKGRSLVDLHGEEKAAEIRKKQSLARKGRIPYNKGLHHTEETKLKLSKIQKDISLKRKQEGYQYSKRGEYCKQKMSAIKKGCSWWNNGHKEILTKDLLQSPWNRGRLKNV